MIAGWKRGGTAAKIAALPLNRISKQALRIFVYEFSFKKS
jgi:hypothetical protein